MTRYFDFNDGGGNCPFPMEVELISAITRGGQFLAAQQFQDGRFEGQLSSMTFPTCALAWVQIVQGQDPDPSLLDWLHNQRLPDGHWSLDASKIPNQNATDFAQLILSYSSTVDAKDSHINLSWPQLGLIKLAYAHLNQFSWSKVTPPALVVLAIRGIQSLLPGLARRMKPPKHLLPSADFFYSKTFNQLFVAEQQTLVPAMILIEAHTKKRRSVVADLLSWMLACRLTDGSWFRVNYITALATLAMVEARRQFTDLVTTEEIESAIAWLEDTRNTDGGCREALNLNVWDTALSTITLTHLSHDPTLTFIPQIQTAARWLIKHQSGDGGWAFSGLDTQKGSAFLLSDGDDTALSTLSLILSQAHVNPDAGPNDSDLTNSSELAVTRSIEHGIQWLANNQSADGSWSTYVPGEGDVGCVSITAHAIEALLAFGGYEDLVNNAINWLRQEITAEGYWSDLWLSKFTYGTACAIVALAKSGLSACAEVKRGLSWLEENQQPDGGWGEDMFGQPTESTVEQTAWTVYALLYARPVHSPDSASPSVAKGLRYLLDRQHQDGSWDAACVGIYWEIIGGYKDPIYASVFPLLALSAYIQQIGTERSGG